MKLKRRFFDTSLDHKQISKQKLVLSIVVSIAIIFAIYGLMYFLRESIRLMSYGLGHLPNILTEFERNTYNWFFAAISVLFGNSIAISLILSGPNRGFAKKNIKRRRIINDNIGLNSYFLFWLAKISLAIGFFSIGVADYNFLPDFKIPMILLILVLYLETWKTLFTVFRRNKYKVFLVHFLLMFFMSFGLSQLEFIDYKTIDENQLSYSPILDLPTTDYENTGNGSYFEDVYLDNEHNKVLFGYYENSIEDSNTDFLDLRLGLWKGVQDRFAIRISSDKNSKMGFIKVVERKIRDANINYLIYAIKPNDVSAKRFSFSGIKVSLKDSLISEDDLLQPIYGFKRFYFKRIENKIYNDTIKIDIQNEIKIEGVIVSNDLLSKTFLKHINKNTVFEYNYDDETDYQNYIKVLSTHFKVLNDVRNRNRKLEPNWNVNGTKLLNKESIYKELRNLRNDFPFNYLENFN